MSLKAPRPLRDRAAVLQPHSPESCLPRASSAAAARCWQVAAPWSQPPERRHSVLTPNTFVCVWDRALPPHGHTPAARLRTLRDDAGLASRRYGSSASRKGPSRAARAAGWGGWRSLAAGPQGGGFLSTRSPCLVSRGAGVPPETWRWWSVRPGLWHRGPHPGLLAAVLSAFSL